MFGEGSEASVQRSLGGGRRMAGRGNWTASSRWRLISSDALPSVPARPFVRWIIYGGERLHCFAYSAARAATHACTTRCTMHARMHPRKPDAALAPSCAVYAISRYVSAATATYPSNTTRQTRLRRIQVQGISNTPTSALREFRFSGTNVRASCRTCSSIRVWMRYSVHANGIYSSYLSLVFALN